MGGGNGEDGFGWSGLLRKGSRFMTHLRFQMVLRSAGAMPTSSSAPALITGS